MTKPYDSMTPGTKYRVHYQIPGVHKVKREMVAVFVGTDPNQFNTDHDRFIFSGRPEFGTSDLERSHLLGAWSTDDSTKCYANRKVRD